MRNDNALSSGHFSPTLFRLLRSDRKFEGLISLTHLPHPPDSESGHNHWIPPRRPLAQPLSSSSTSWVYDTPRLTHNRVHHEKSREYAHWGRRAGAALIDAAFATPYLIAVSATVFSMDFGIVTETSGTGGDHSPDRDLTVLTLIVGILTLAFFLWNSVVQQGRTGSTIGKSLLGLCVVFEETGQPIGPGNSLLRQLLHVLDSLVCFLGFLFPLWEAKRRTFADMIMKTVVTHCLG